MDPVARSREEAARIWPHYRRKVWAASSVGHIPTAAEIHDGLQTSGFDLLWSTWQSERFNLEAIRAALADDRACIENFRRRDPHGAQEIADFLAMFLEYLTRVDAEAQRIAESTAEHYWNRGAPHNILKGTRYGDAGIMSTQAIYTNRKVH